MCVKLPPGDLNLGHFPLHPTNTYTCKVTIAPKVFRGLLKIKFNYITLFSLYCHLCFNFILFIPLISLHRNCTIHSPR